MSQEMPVVTVDNAPLNAQIMIDTLKKCGATHLVWLPDTESGQAVDPLIRITQSAREVALVP